MKTEFQKVTYQTDKGLKFNTIITADNADQATVIMGNTYAFDRIIILKIRPSVKRLYKKVCNYRIK